MSVSPHASRSLARGRFLVKVGRQTSAEVEPCQEVDRCDYTGRMFHPARRRLVQAALRRADAGPGAGLARHRRGAGRAADRAHGLGKDARRLPLLPGRARAQVRRRRARRPDRDRLRLAAQGAVQRHPPQPRRAAGRAGGASRPRWASARPAIRTAVRTGDTSAAERRQGAKRPPHVLVTTPESLYILLTSESGRRGLAGARTVIVDEIHAVAGDKRGAHLALSLERLEHLVIAGGRPASPAHRALRHGQAHRDGRAAPRRRRPPAARHRGRGPAPRSRPGGRGAARRAGRGLHPRAVGRDLRPRGRAGPRAPVDAGLRQHAAPRRARDAAPRGAPGPGRRRRASRQPEPPAALRRRAAPQVGRALRGRRDRLARARASTSARWTSTCLLGSPRSIATGLQRIGRSGHALGATPKGRLFPLTRDQLVECAALVRAARRGRAGPHRASRARRSTSSPSRSWPPAPPKSGTRTASSPSAARAAPYAELDRAEFDAVVDMLSEGIATRRGPRGSAHSPRRGRPPAQGPPRGAPGRPHLGRRHPRQRQLRRRPRARRDADRHGRRGLRGRVHGGRRDAARQHLVAHPARREREGAGGGRGRRGADHPLLARRGPRAHAGALSRGGRRSARKSPGASTIPRQRARWLMDEGALDRRGARAGARLHRRGPRGAGRRAHARHHRRRALLRRGRRPAARSSTRPSAAGSTAPGAWRCASASARASTSSCRPRPPTTACSSRSAPSTASRSSRSSRWSIPRASCAC